MVVYFIFFQAKDKKGPTAKRSVPFRKVEASSDDKSDETVLDIKQELNKDDTEQRVQAKPGALLLKPLSSLMAPAPASVKAKKNQSAPDPQLSTNGLPTPPGCITTTANSSNDNHIIRLIDMSS